MSRIVVFGAPDYFKRIAVFGCPHWLTLHIIIVFSCNGVIMVQAL